MTTISARIIADSISPTGQRLTTMHLRYPRFVHAEAMTHRVFSRNARSSRAVPVPKMIQECIDDPVIPIHWGAAQSGMQAYEQCDNGVFLQGFPEDLTAKQAWLVARDNAVWVAEAFHAAGYAKQNINRLLEPFLHIDTLVTATEWENFFALRDHHAAEPHIQVLARAMKQAMAESKPEALPNGCWHAPYTAADDHMIGLSCDTRRFPTCNSIDDFILKLSVARCARISYAPFEGEGSIEKDIALADSLLANGHMSPFEHQATPDTYIDDRAIVKQWRNPRRSRNFVGWVQNRGLVEAA